MYKKKSKNTSASERVSSGLNFIENNISPFPDNILYASLFSISILVPGGTLKSF